MFPITPFLFVLISIEVKSITPCIQYFNQSKHKPIHLDKQRHSVCLKIAKSHCSANYITRADDCCECRLSHLREKESAECLTKDTKEGHCQLNYDKDETERGYF